MDACNSQPSQHRTHTRLTTTNLAHLAPCADTRRNASSPPAPSATSRAMEVEGVFSGVPVHAGPNGADLLLSSFAPDERDSPIFTARLGALEVTGVGSHGRGSREAVSGTSSALLAKTWVDFGVTPALAIDEAPRRLLPLPLLSPLPAPPSPPATPLPPSLSPQGAVLLGTD